MILTKRLYRIEEVASLLSFSRSMIYGLIKEDKLTVLSRNGEKVKPYRVTAESIQMFIQVHLVDPDDWRK